MKWNLEKEIVKEEKYTSGKWHLYENEKGIYVTNSDILCTPSGIGANEKEAFSAMLNNIAVYEERLKNIKAEIEAHLAELEQGK